MIGSSQKQDQGCNAKRFIVMKYLLVVSCFIRTGGKNQGAGYQYFYLHVKNSAKFNTLKLYMVNIPGKSFCPDPFVQLFYSRHRHTGAAPARGRSFTPPGHPARHLSLQRTCGMCRNTISRAGGLRQQTIRGKNIISLQHHLAAAFRYRHR